MMREKKMFKYPALSLPANLFTALHLCSGLIREKRSELIVFAYCCYYNVWREGNVIQFNMIIRCMLTELNDIGRKGAIWKPCSP